MAEQKKMSVSEILAAARKADSKKKGAESEPAAAAEEAAPETSAAAPAAKAAAPPAAPKPSKPAAASGERPSVSEILARARAGKAGGAKSAPAKKPAASAKAATAKKDVKPAAAKAAAPAKVPRGSSPATARDTSSILAAARKPHKLGPMSKAEAKAKGKELPKAGAATAAPPMPAKPEYALRKPQPTPKVDGGRRLAILSMAMGSALALGFSSLTATLGLWLLGTVRFMFPNVLREPPSKFKVGFPDDFAPGYVATKFKSQYGVWVVNWQYNGIPEIYALKSVCTHLGCTPNWLEAEQKFKCPCHGSGFYKDGINFEGPAPRPLERFAIRVADDGQLEIDKSRTFHQEMGAWEDPASYVPA